jgi:hypothetical protein
METIKRASSHQAALSAAGGTSEPPCPDLPALNALFTDLAAGITPNFLDIFDACPANVAFLIECDLFSDVRSDSSEKRSGKVGRFCYR